MTGSSHGCGPTWHEASVRIWAAWCWLAYRRSHFWRTTPVSCFSLSLATYGHDNSHVVFPLFVRNRTCFPASSRRITCINLSVFPRSMVRESAVGARPELEPGRRGTARKTTILKCIRSQPEWIRVLVGPRGYIPGEHVFRVCDPPMYHWNSLIHTLDSRWDFFTGNDPTK